MQRAHLVHPVHGAKYQRSGVVLLITLVILVVLTVFTYRVTGKVAAHRRRQQYQVDYVKARYACDSALKLVLTQMEELKPVLVERPNEPDFSTVFAMSEEEYQEVLEEYAAELEYMDWYGLNEEEDFDENVGDMNDMNDVNDANAADPLGGWGGSNDPCSTDNLIIRGPYGPEWPLVVPPLEFEIGDAKVHVEIEDENAKYPLTWMLLLDSPQSPEIENGFEVFLEWMNYEGDIDALKEQVTMVGEMRPYQLAYEEPAKNAANTAAQKTAASKMPARGRISRTAPGRTGAAAQAAKKPLSAADKSARQTTDVTRLLNSSLLDLDSLARATIESDTRNEMPLKYIGLWGTNKVNINTAPQHVLNAAFMFAGSTKAADIANKVAERRRYEPIQDLEDLKKLAGYADAIEKCQDYIVLASTQYTVKITVTCGAAQAHTVLAVAREGDKVRKLAVKSS